MTLDTTMTRDMLREKIARVMFDCYRGYNEETQRHMWMMAKSELGRKADAVLAAIHEAGLAVAPYDTLPIILASGWADINAGRKQAVDMAPGPALKEAWPKMLAAADLARPIRDEG